MTLPITRSGFWIQNREKMNIGYQGKERDFVNDVVRKHPAEIVYHSARMVRVEAQEVNVVCHRLQQASSIVLSRDSYISVK